MAEERASAMRALTALCSYALCGPTSIGLRKPRHITHRAVKSTPAKSPLCSTGGLTSGHDLKSVPAAEGRADMSCGARPKAIAVQRPGAHPSGCSTTTAACPWPAATGCTPQWRRPSSPEGGQRGAGSACGVCGPSLFRCPNPHHTHARTSALLSASCELRACAGRRADGVSFVWL
jgi:hypothetical protein